MAVYADMVRDALTKEPGCVICASLRDVGVLYSASEVDGLSAEGPDFLKGLLNRNPKHRLGATAGAAELKSHPFFHDIDWDALANRKTIPPFKVKVMPESEFIDPSLEYTPLGDPATAMAAPGAAALGFGSLYMTAPSTFASASIYMTPSSQPISYLRNEHIPPSYPGHFASIPEEPLGDSSSAYERLIRGRGLVLPPEREINWSGKGQHVEFSRGEAIPITAISMIGQSSSATVEMVRCRRILLARKSMTCRVALKLEDAMNEVEHLLRLRHPHVVQLVGSYLQS